MVYKILYIDDQAAESRESDLKDLGFDVKSINPSSDMSIIMSLINSFHPNALVLDYRLTEGENNACFDAPTIAQTIRTKHSVDYLNIPIVLMSNENVITDYYKDYSSQDLFDFVVTKKQFNDNKSKFKEKIESFITSYHKVIEFDFDIVKILGLEENEKNLIHSQIISKLNEKKGFIFQHTRLVNDTLIYSIGSLIGEDVLSARLGISKDSEDWEEVLFSLNDAKYKGIFSHIHKRWWMSKVDLWWKNIVKCEIPLRRLNARERVDLIKANLSLESLIVNEKTTLSQSSNFWTICKFSKAPIDPFDGIELLVKNLLPWQEKEYLSIDSALSEIEDYRNKISEIDKKAIRELSKKIIDE
jgi:hypothetical protein